ncbi:Uncharacterised protein [Streptococcus pneumoniae]|nr:Uncharacterised protein [Streptococcus pneumoniae]
MQRGTALRVGQHRGAAVVQQDQVELLGTVALGDARPQGQAHAAVALRLDDGERARLGDAEVRPGDRHLRAQELLAQVSA